MHSIATYYMTQALYASVHSADPGDTGAGEITTIARLPITWTDNGDGSISSNQLDFSIPAGTEVFAVGLWDAATAGTFLDSYDNDIIFTDAGTYSVVLNMAVAGDS